MPNFITQIAEILNFNSFARNMIDAYLVLTLIRSIKLVASLVSMAEWSRALVCI